MRYLRNERNLGAARNYNRAWHESSGAYFKWLAHDDRIAPTYIAATVAALDAAPDAVLCNTVVDYIDPQGTVFAFYDSVLGEASGPDPVQRFAAMVLRSHSCVDMFGMIRRSAMEGSLLHATFHGADRAFLAQMALRGRLLQLPEHLVQMREHRNRYTRQQASAKSGGYGTIRIHVGFRACRRSTSTASTSNWSATRLSPRLPVGAAMPYSCAGGSPTGTRSALAPTRPA